MNTAAQVSRQRQEGYRLACMREPSTGTVVAVAGYRVFETFFDGKVAAHSTSTLANLCTLRVNASAGNTQR